MDRLSPSDIQYQLEHIDESRTLELLVTQIICLVLAAAAVILRLLSRRLNKASIQSDDYMTLVALALITGYLILCIVAIHYGAGKHLILLKHPVVFLKLVFAIVIVYLVGIATVKLSILLLYRRIFGVSQRFNSFSWGLGIFILAYTLAGIFIVIFQCEPVHGAWDITIKAKCIDFSVPAIIFASFNVVTDVLTLALPMPLIWKLQMSGRRKLQVAIIFLLGGLVCIGSIYRAAIIHRLYQPDASWYDSDPSIWACVEMSIGVVSACLPTLRPIVHWISHGGTYERRAEEDHIKRRSGAKRGPLSWMFPSSLMRSQAKTNELVQEESAETDGRV